MSDNVINPIDAKAKATAPQTAEREHKHPQVDLEKVTFYEIDKSDRDDHVLTEEEMAKNDEFLQKHLIPELTKRAKICDCRMQQVIEKNIRKAQLMNMDPRQLHVTLDQSDIDACNFGVIVTSVDGVYDGIACITVECAECRKLDIYGDGSIITTLLAKDLYRTYHSGAQSELSTAEDGVSLEDLYNSEDTIFEDLPDDVPPADSGPDQE